MTARAIMGLLPAPWPRAAQIRYRDRNLLGLNERGWQAMRGSEIGLIMQDPFTMLNPVHYLRGHPRASRSRASGA